MARQPVRVLVDPLRKLLRRGARGHVQNMLAKLHAADVARLFDYLNDQECDEVFGLMASEEPGRMAEMVSELSPEDTIRLFDRLPEQKTAQIVAALDSDDAAELLAAMPDEAAEQVLGLLRDSDSAPIEGLLLYEDETAGRIMSPEVFALEEHMAVEDAISEIRGSAGQDFEMVFYLYVVDDRYHLVGVCSLRDLLLASPDALLADVMNHRVISVRTDTDQEEVARLVARYDYLALPVVDHENKLVGIITVDDVIDVIQEEETEDMLLMAGVGDGDGEEVLRAPLWRNAWLRLPWLCAAFAGGMVASRFIAGYEAILTEVVALSYFIPIILGMGGNAGTQSATIVVRGLATGRITREQGIRFVFREVRVALTMGVIFGLGVVGLLVGLGELGLMPVEVSGSSQPLVLGMVVGLAITVTMTLAASVGTSMPIVLDRLGADPAIATGPFVTTAIDVLGVLAYFSIATALMTAVAV